MTEFGRGRPDHHVATSSGAWGSCRQWYSRKDNLPLADLLGQPHAYNIDPNYPHSMGMFVAHRL